MEALYSSVDKQIFKSIELLSEYISYPSVSAQNKSIYETVNFISQTIKKMGGEIRVLDNPEGNPIIYSFFSADNKGNANKTLLFYNHYDVQPPDPLKEWKSDPFTLTEKNGIFFARGNVTLAIIITAFVTITYTAFGGLSGVALTDWVQAIIMIISVIILVVFGLIHISGDNNIILATIESKGILSQSLGSGFLNLTDGITFFTVFAWTLAFMPNNTISQTQMQRIYAAKSVKTIQKISLIMVVFLIFCYFAITLVGIIGREILPGLEDSEMIYPLLSLELLNPYVAMFVITGLIAAAMSSADSALLGSGIHISRDIYERFKSGRDVNEKHSIRLTRIAILIIGIISAVAALLAPSILDLLLATMKVSSGATIVPVIAGLYWSKANSRGAMAGLLLGGISTIIGQLFETPIDPVILGIIFSSLGLVIGSLIKQSPVSTIFSFRTTEEGMGMNSFLVTTGFLILCLLSLTISYLWGIFILISLLALLLSVIILIWVAIFDSTYKKNN